MKVASGILLVCMLSGVLTIVWGEDCKSGFKKAMCKTFCMLNKLVDGQCKIAEGKDKCHCYGKRSLPEDDEVARSFLEFNEMEKMFDSDEFSFEDERIESVENPNLGLEEARLSCQSKPGGCTTGK